MKSLQSFNPANGEVIYSGFETPLDSISQVFEKAQSVHNSWASRTFEERLLLLQSFQKCIAAHQSELAELISKETGKPLWDSKSETSALIQKVDISIAAFKERCAHKNESIANYQLEVSFKPHGTVAVFGPYNFPMHLPNGHIVPALLAGNCVIFKPSEKTPASGEALFRCFKEAKIPDGVLQLVQGGIEVGQALADHSMLNGLFFTGSAKAGSSLLERLSKTPGKILALEMGGNNPLVITSYSHLQATLHLILLSAFLTSGQRCTCARRLILVRNRDNEHLVPELVKAINNLKLGAYTSTPEPFMGPLIDRNAAKNVEEFYNKLLTRGAKAVMPLKEREPDSAFIYPTLVDVTDVKNLPDEECFGPLLQLIWVKDFEAAIQLANQTQYGLSAGLISCDPLEWEHFKRKINAGVINWNMPTTGASGKAPFGGIKDSGNFRPSGLFAADYCSYPVASQVAETQELPKTLSPGLNL